MMMYNGSKIVKITIKDIIAIITVIITVIDGYSISDFINL